MEGILSIFVVPLIIFMVVIAPIWLAFHYRTKGKIGAGLADNEREQLQQLLLRSAQMQERVSVLEEILDKELPGWRNKV